MPNNPRQSESATATSNDFDNSNQEIGAKRLAQTAGSQKASLAQELNQAQDRDRNLQKNERLASLAPLMANGNQPAETKQKTDSRSALKQSFNYLRTGLGNQKQPSESPPTETPPANDENSQPEANEQPNEINQAQNTARNQNKNDTLAQKVGTQATATAQNIALKESSKAILNALWVSVWGDITLLSLLGLNVYLFASLLIPSLAQFGEDDIVGTPLGGGRIAQLSGQTGAGNILPKVIEIIIVLIADVIVLIVILLIFYLIYKITSAGTWTQFRLLINTVSGDFAEVIELLTK